MGKKFDAHKKYFDAKEVKIRQELRHINEWMTEVNNINNQLAKENKELFKQKFKLEVQLAELLKRTNMTKDDLNIFIHNNKSMDKFGSILEMISRQF